jgi:lipoprotein-anchoring transpeptidase ErfK/SrfK
MPTKNEIRSKTRKTGFLLVAVLLSAAALGQQAPTTNIAVESEAPARRIVVSIPDRKLALIEDGAVKKIFPVAVGKLSTPSPSGSFRIVSRVSNPTYYHEGNIVPPGPANPIGTRWMGLSQRGYGIHGTNAPGSIGKAASHGCIRMARADLEQLFAMVQVGDAVEIHAEQDQQLERIFGAADVTELADAAAGAHSAAQ